MTELSLNSLPGPLADLVAERWQRFREAGGELPAALKSELPKVWAGSDYVAEQMQRLPALCQWLAQPGCLDQPLDAHRLRSEIAAALADCDD